MKRFVISGSILVFLAVFLLWPTTTYGDQGADNVCNDAGGASAVLGNCLPSEEINTWGGGVWYLSKAIGSGKLKQDSSNDYNYYSEYGYGTGEKIFHPVDAVKGALFSALLAGSVGYGFVRLKRNRRKKAT